MQAPNSLSAEQHYVLGAELAQAGEYRRAVEEMTRAIALEPELHTARFQLGLLLFTMGRPEAALEQWTRLRQTAVGGLNHFAEGLEALGRDDFDRCVAALETGITHNTTNPPLNDDMRRLIERIRERAPAGSPPTADDSPAASVRTDFSLYDQKAK